jgi:hypothetical protein
MSKFVNLDLPLIMPALEMSDEPLPLIWTADFILGPKDAEGKDTYVVGEFNCSCVGISQQLHLAPMLAAAAITVCSESKKSKAPINSECSKFAPVSFYLFEPRFVFHVPLTRFTDRAHGWRDCRTRACTTFACGHHRCAGVRRWH